MTSEAYNPYLTIYLEVREDKAGIYYKNFLPEPYLSEPEFKDGLKKIIMNNGHTGAVRSPRPNLDSRRNTTRASILCNGTDTEFVLYIPKGTGSFDLNIVPFSNFDNDIIGNLRLYYVDSGKLHEVSTFSGNPDVQSQLAVFSYSGKKASSDRGTPYTKVFDINAKDPRLFPGSGDIGHPGGND
ncbi:hypothetical protein GCM10009096_19310 [Parasphingorhabdus litoris]|uniref:Uncharacterized protein n=1 Tax=Parasphingorhabdus litoris TaxID=394733 RepID=A0ABN1AIQ5_9SPHN|nr:hypothetical protein [Parasphingorhabdus litoris]